MAGQPGYISKDKFEAQKNPSLSGPAPELDYMTGGQFAKGAFQHGGNWYFKNADGKVQYVGKKKPNVKTTLAAPKGFNFRHAYSVPAKPKKNPSTTTPTGTTPAATTPTAAGPSGPFWGPWAEGFSAAGTPWGMLAGGGWFNRSTGHTWKPGDAIPGVGGAATDPSMQIYNSLISALTNILQPTVPAPTTPKV